MMKATMMTSSRNRNRWDYYCCEMCDGALGSKNKKYLHRRVRRNEDRAWRREHGL